MPFLLSLLLPLSAALAEAPVVDPEQPALALVFSGGASKGPFQSGAAWELSKTLADGRLGALTGATAGERPGLVFTGASAGAVNGMIAALEAVHPRRAAEGAQDPRRSLYYQTWVMTGIQADEPNSIRRRPGDWALSLQSQDALIDGIAAEFQAREGDAPSLDSAGGPYAHVLYGVQVTRLLPMLDDPALLLGRSPALQVSESFAWKHLSEERGGLAPVGLRCVAGEVDPEDHLLPGVGEAIAARQAKHPERDPSKNVQQGLLEAAVRYNQGLDYDEWKARAFPRCSADVAELRYLGRHLIEGRSPPLDSSGGHKPYWPEDPHQIGDGRTYPLEVGEVAAQIRKSTLFPVAFQPLQQDCVDYTLNSFWSPRPCDPAGHYDDSFTVIDGGLYENNPLRLTLELSGRARKLTILYVDAHIAAPLRGTAPYSPRPADPTRPWEVTPEVFRTVSRTMTKQSVADFYRDFVDTGANGGGVSVVTVPARVSAFGDFLGHFFAFFDRSFRVWDFYAGSYSGRLFLEEQGLHRPTPRPASPSAEEGVGTRLDRVFDALRQDPFLDPRVGNCLSEFIGLQTRRRGRPSALETCLAEVPLTTCAIDGERGRGITAAPASSPRDPCPAESAQVIDTGPVRMPREGRVAMAEAQRMARVRGAVVAAFPQGQQASVRPELRATLPGEDRPTAWGDPEAREGEELAFYRNMRLLSLLGAMRASRVNLARAGQDLNYEELASLMSDPAPLFDLATGAGATLPPEERPRFEARDIIHTLESEGIAAPARFDHQMQALMRSLLAELLGSGPFMDWEAAFGGRPGTMSPFYRTLLPDLDPHSALHITLPSTRWAIGGLPASEAVVAACQEVGCDTYSSPAVSPFGLYLDLPFGREVNPRHLRLGLEPFVQRDELRWVTGAVELIVPTRWFGGESSGLLVPRPISAQVGPALRYALPWCAGLTLDCFTSPSPAVEAMQVNAIGEPALPFHTAQVEADLKMRLIIAQGIFALEPSVGAQLRRFGSGGDLEPGPWRWSPQLGLSLSTWPGVWSRRGADIRYVSDLPPGRIERSGSLPFVEDLAMASLPRAGLPGESQVPSRRYLIYSTPALDRGRRPVEPMQAIDMHHGTELPLRSPLQGPALPPAPRAIAIRGEVPGQPIELLVAEAAADGSRTDRVLSWPLETRLGRLELGAGRVLPPLPDPPAGRCWRVVELVVDQDHSILALLTERAEGQCGGALGDIALRGEARALRLPREGQSWIWTDIELKGEPLGATYDRTRLLVSTTGLGDRGRVVAFEESLLQPVQQLRLRDPIGRLQSGQPGCVYGVALDPDHEQVDEASLGALHWTGSRYRLQHLSRLSDRVDPSAASAYEKLESQLDRPQSLLVVDGQLWIGQQGARGLVSYTPPTDLARSALCPSQDQR